MVAGERCLIGRSAETMMHYLPPHICKYCGRFYHDVTRYLFHKRQHEKWIRPYWYDFKIAQVAKSKSERYFSRVRKALRNDSAIIECVQMNTCKVLLHGVGLDITNDLISNSQNLNSVPIHTKEM